MNEDPEFCEQTELSLELLEPPPDSSDPRHWSLLPVGRWAGMWWPDKETLLKAVETFNGMPSYVGHVGTEFAKEFAEYTDFEVIEI